MEGGGDSKEWHREERVHLIRAHHSLWTREHIHMNSLRVLQMVHQGMVPFETTPHF